MIPTTLDSWAIGLLCDPLSKTPLKKQGQLLVSDYGRVYPLVNGVYDLRLLTSNAGENSEKWLKGQVEYEQFSAKLAQREKEDYRSQKQGVAEVYAEIPVMGRCLDIGGNDGRLRAFLAPKQEYISIDPFIDILNEPKSNAFYEAYPACREPLNFVSALAEHLPFVNASFDTVHMRSVIDHFSNPELALRESFRVLKPGANLIVGLYVEGGRSGKSGHFKNGIRSVLTQAGLSRFADHHIWHPTYEELRSLITCTGFSIQNTHWQKSEGDRVCYLHALKSLPQT